MSAAGGVDTRLMILKTYKILPTLCDLVLAIMADIVAAPAFKKRTNKAANVRKRPATPPPDGSDSDSYTEDDETGARVKRRRKDGLTASTQLDKANVQPVSDLSRSSKFEADRSSTIQQSEDATKFRIYQSEYAYFII